MWSLLICLDHLNLTYVGHGAANVTLGIPRLREIIMTASTKPKTPSMTMDVRAGTATPDIDVFCKKAGRLTMSQVVDKVLVRERLVSNGGSRLKEYLVDLAFYPKADYQQEYDVEPSEILAAFATRFPLILRKEIQNELKRLDQDLKSQMKDLGKGKAAPSRSGESARDGDDDGDAEPDGSRREKDDDETSEVGDGDATVSKRRRQAKELVSYDDDEDDEDDGKSMGELDEDAIEAAYASMDEDEVEKAPEPKEASSAKEFKAQLHATEQLFMQNFPHASSFTFKESGCTIGFEVYSIITVPRADIDSRLAPIRYAKASACRYR